MTNPSMEAMIRGVLAHLPLAAQRMAYRLTYRGMRLWWALRRPAGCGAGVALWHGDRLLLIRTSYRAALDLPGGGIERGEDPADAARRELLEETGIALGPTDLGPAVIARFRFEHRLITSTVFPVIVMTAPDPVVDGAEIVWAGFLEASVVPREDLAPGLAAYLAQVGEAGAAWHDDHTIP